jgi:hypothetical protein
MGFLGVQIAWKAELAEYKYSAGEVNMGAFMLSEEAKKQIESLSKGELRQEIDKGRLSRFKGEKFAYCQTRLANLEQQEQEERHQQDVSQKHEELSIAREANQISRNANNLSKIAIAISIISIIAAIIALWRH